jgi:hypothetical protein
MALLRYYSSQCVAQGAYTVAMDVGFLVFFKPLSYNLDFAVGVDLRLSRAHKKHYT